MNNLSLSAQAVLDAAEPCVWPSECPGLEGAMAAALRAAADHLTDASSSHTLYAIADELEGITYGAYRCNLEAR